MKILIICSKNFYSEIEDIKNDLESREIEVYYPNCYDDPTTEQRMWEMGKEEHRKFKDRMFRQSIETISQMDAVLVLNFDKEKDGVIYKNYIGGATFLEMYEAYMRGKKIYLYNDIPKGMAYDEIEGFAPIVINGNLTLINTLKTVKGILANRDEFFKPIEDTNCHLTEQSLIDGEVHAYKREVLGDMIYNDTIKYASESSLESNGYDVPYERTLK